VNPSENVSARELSLGPTHCKGHANVVNNFPFHCILNIKYDLQILLSNSVDVITIIDAA
jgi:hypothetical protein